MSWMRDGRELSNFHLSISKKQGNVSCDYIPASTGRGNRYDISKQQEARVSIYMRDKAEKFVMS